MIANIISWIVLGLVAGWLAKLIMPGKEPGGKMLQMGLGIAGAFIGGLMNGVLKILPEVRIAGQGFLPGLGDIITATLGAIVLIAVYNFVKKKKGAGKK